MVRPVRTPLDHQIPFPLDCPKLAQQYVGELNSILEKARANAALNLYERKFFMRDSAATKATNHTFHVGDMVYLETPVLAAIQKYEVGIPNGKGLIISLLNLPTYILRSGKLVKIHCTKVEFMLIDLSMLYVDW